MPRATDWNPNADLPPVRLTPPAWWPAGVRFEFDLWPHDDTKADWPYWNLEVVRSPLTE
jgi:hypothetical protein